MTSVVVAVRNAVSYTVVLFVRCDARHRMLISPFTYPFRLSFVLEHLSCKYRIVSLKNNFELFGT